MESEEKVGETVLVVSDEEREKVRMYHRKDDATVDKTGMEFVQIVKRCKDGGTWDELLNHVKGARFTRMTIPKNDRDMVHNHAIALATWRNAPVVVWEAFMAPKEYKTVRVGVNVGYDSTLPNATRLEVYGAMKLPIAPPIPVQIFGLRAVELSDEKIGELRNMLKAARYFEPLIVGVLEAAQTAAMLHQVAVDNENGTTVQDAPDMFYR